MLADEALLPYLEKIHVIENSVEELEKVAAHLDEYSRALGLSSPRPLPLFSALTISLQSKK